MWQQSYPLMARLPSHDTRMTLPTETVLYQVMTYLITQLLYYLML